MAQQSVEQLSSIVQQQNVPTIVQQQSVPTIVVPSVLIAPLPIEPLPTIAPLPSVSITPLPIEPLPTIAPLPSDVLGVVSNVSNTQESNLQLNVIHWTLVGIFGGIFMIAMIIVITARIKEKMRRNRIRRIPIQLLMKSVT